MAIRKLNKRLIYGVLIGVACLFIPALVSLVSSGKPKASLVNAENKAHANQNTADVFVISGVDRFPEHYGMVKEFEAHMAKEAPSDENFIKALSDLEKISKKDQPTTQTHWANNAEDNPWREAKKREQKQRAFDHYDAKRSDILFFDANKTRNSITKQNSQEDAMLNLMERSLAMAENHARDPGPNDMFFMKPEQSQDNHKAFLRSGKSNAGQLTSPNTPFLVSEGTLINAILLSEVNTDLPGPILARVSHNIWDSKTGKILLIPQNSKLIGEYNSSIGNGQNRAQIVWTRIIYPNQQSVELSRMVGVDTKGVSGSAGLVNNHYDKVAMGLLMTTAIGAGIRLTQGKYEPNSASIGQELGNSLAQETARLGNKIADKMLAIKPTIKVPMGEKLNVFVEQDLSLKPYGG